MRLICATIAVLLAAVVASAAIAAPLPGSTSFDPSSVVNVTGHPLTPRDAPADEYFGIMKLSNLGIRNIIHAFAVEGNSPLALPLQRTRIMAVHSALVAWGDEFPRDTWLRNTTLNFTNELTAKHDLAADMTAIDLLLQASQRFRNTPYGRKALDQMRAIAPTTEVDWTVPPFDPPTLSDVVVLQQH
jgi:hypothetical protein